MRLVALGVTVVLVLASQPSRAEAQTSLAPETPTPRTPPPTSPAAANPAPAKEAKPATPSGPGEATAEDVADQDPTPPREAEATAGTETGVLETELAGHGGPDTAEDAPGADAVPPTTLTANELAELGLTRGEDGLAEPEREMQLYGFADFRFFALLVPQDSAWRGLINRHPAFWIGNFNLYVSREVVESVRMLGEIRFTFLPNGSPEFASPTGELTSTATEDYDDYRRELRWGAIEIERVYLEWSWSSLLAVRAGLFLTPYGIWNVDHGSPTIIPVQRPFVIGEALFPERQMGLEAFGQARLDGNNVLGYHATLSNGIGPASEYRDFDDNKALGGRLYWANEAFGRFRLGISAFYGTESEATEVPGLSATGRIAFSERISYKADILALAADLSWSLDGLLVQAELVSQQRRLDENTRVGVINPLSGDYIAPKDGFSIGGYTLLGYRFTWLGVMPYAMVEYIDTTYRKVALGYEAISFSAGVNVRPVPEIALKLQYDERHFPAGILFADGPVRGLQTQLAWAF